MRGVVTFTTDFGLRDPFVAVMKGQVLRRNPDLSLVDITHDIAPFQPAEAGFWLARISRYFPSGAVHVAVVDPGVGTARGLIAVLSEGQLFLAPDNGLLTGVAAQPGAVCRRIASSTFHGIGAAAEGPTFHGRDLLAPLAAEIASGRVAFVDLGDLCRPVEIAELLPAEAQGTALLGQVVTVDHFGNLISNIDKSRIDAGRDWLILLGDRKVPHVAAYGAEPPGSLVAVLNAWGLVEVAIGAGNASRELGLGRGEPLTLVYRGGG